MFSDEQIHFMREIGLDFNFDTLSDEEYFQIEERVADELQYRGFDENYKPTVCGKMCEAILDELASI